MKDKKKFIFTIKTVLNDSEIKVRSQSSCGKCGNGRCGGGKPKK